MKNGPLLWLSNLLEWWLNDQIWEEISGDLEEAYQNRLKYKPAWIAKFLFIKEAISSMKWNQSRFKNSFYNQGLFLNNWKQAFRFLKKEKSTSSLHILGFSIGMTTCFLLFTFYSHEKSFDKFHRNFDSIYRVVTEIDPQNLVGLTPWPTGPFLTNEFPEIQSTRIYHTFRKVPVLTKMDGTSFYEDDLFFVDSTFFKVFSFKLLAGNIETVLHEPNSIILTKRLARKFFGREDAIGEELMFESDIRLTVTGIVEDPPSNSHFQYQALAPLIEIDRIFEATGNTFSHDGWYWTAVNTYVRIPASMNVSTLERHLMVLTKNHVPKEFAERRIFKAQPLSEIHLKSVKINDLFVEKRSVLEVNGALVLAILVFFIAFINFSNLTTSAATERIKSIVIRRIMGGGIWQIGMQLLLETIIISLISLSISIMLVWAIFPHFNDFINANIRITEYLNPSTLPIIIMITLSIGLLAGLYPATYTLNLALQRSVRGNLTLNPGAKPLLRLGLVTFQFLTSIVLIFCSITIYRQFDLLVNKELGYVKENIVMVPIKGTSISNHLETFKGQLDQMPGVSHSTVISDILGRGTTTVPYFINGSQEETSIPTFFVGFDFVKTYGLEIIEGRDYDKNIVSDSAAYLINESARKYFSDNSWQEADLGRGGGRIIGVIRDFHFSDLRRPVHPLVVGIDEDWQNYITVRLDSGDVGPVIAELATLWSDFEKRKPFDPIFLEDRLLSIYEREKDQMYLMGVFSFLSIVLACLGLLALITFTIKYKLKEIAIRKVLGANTREVYLLVVKDFGVLFLIAMFLSLPISNNAMRYWLNHYPNRVELDWQYFILSAALVALLSWLAISYRSIKASVTNPAEVIKCE